LIEKRLKLFLDDFNRNLIGRGVAVARTSRPIPTFLYIERVENSEDFVGCLVPVYLS